VGDSHHLSTALASRDIIGQAKGIVMERFHIDADHAFARSSPGKAPRHGKLPGPSEIELSRLTIGSTGVAQ
jgi:hypothetical protein